MTTGLLDQPLLDGNKSETDYWQLFHPSGVPKWDAIEQIFGGRHQHGHRHIQVVRVQRSILTDAFIRVESRQLASDMLDFIIKSLISHSCFATMFALYSALLLLAGVIGLTVLKSLPIAIGGFMSGLFFAVLSLTYFVRERKRRNGIEELRMRKANLLRVAEVMQMVSWSTAPTLMRLSPQNIWMSGTDTSLLQ
jgi:hypothetical protein